MYLSLVNITASKQFTLRNGSVIKVKLNHDTPENNTGSGPKTDGLRRLDINVEKVEEPQLEKDLKYPENDETQDVIHHELLDPVNSGREVILRLQY